MCLRPPRGFHDFIRERVVPAFKEQRAIDQNQFAVLLLVSEEEFEDLNSMTFHPSGEPLTDCLEVSMPSKRKQYRNYIVARYESIRESSDKVDPIDRHSEETIINELKHLWKQYMKFTKGVAPKCFILYSWNFPCTDCTEIIISALKQPPYKGISMIVAFSQHWRGEASSDVYRNRKQMRKKGIYFTKVNGVKLNDSDSDSDSGDGSESESDDSDGDDENDSDDPYAFNDDDIDWGGLSLTDTHEQEHDFDDGDQDSSDPQDFDDDANDTYDFDDNLDIDDVEDFDGDLEDHNNLYIVTYADSDEDSSDHGDIIDSSKIESDGGLYSDDAYYYYNSYDDDYDDDEYD